MKRERSGAFLFVRNGGIMLGIETMNKKYLIIVAVAVVLIGVSSFDVFAMSPPRVGPVYGLKIETKNIPDGLDVSLEGDNLKINNETNEIARFYINNIEIFRAANNEAFARSISTRITKINTDTRAVVDEKSIENLSSGYPGSSDLFFDGEGNIYLITSGQEKILRIKSFKDTPEVLIQGGQLKYSRQQQQSSAKQYGCFYGASFAKENEMVVIDGLCNSFPPENVLKIIDKNSLELSIVKKDSVPSMSKIAASRDGDIYLLGDNILSHLPYLNRKDSLWKSIDLSLNKNPEQPRYAYARDIETDMFGDVFILHDSGIVRVIKKDGQELELDAFKKISSNFYFNNLATEDGDAIYVLGAEKLGAGNLYGYKIFKYKQSTGKLETIEVSDLYFVSDIKVYNNNLYILDAGNVFKKVAQPVFRTSNYINEFSEGELTINGKLGDKSFTILGHNEIVGFSGGAGVVPTPFFGTFLILFEIHLVAISAFAIALVIALIIVYIFRYKHINIKRYILLPLLSLIASFVIIFFILPKFINVPNINTVVSSEVIKIIGRFN